MSRWTQPIPDHSTEPGEREIESPIMSEWINLNSSAARLYGRKTFTSFRFPVWTFRCSFEGHGGGSVAIRRMRILGAAQWAVYSAVSLL